MQDDHKFEHLVLDDDDWQKIEAACARITWYPVIVRLKERNNKPTNLAHLDTLLKQKLPKYVKDRYPTKARAMVQLNTEMRHAGLFYRIRKISEGANSYEGVVQIMRLKPEWADKQKPKVEVQPA